MYEYGEYLWKHSGGGTFNSNWRERNFMSTFPMLTFCRKLSARTTISERSIWVQDLQDSVFDLQIESMICTNILPSKV